MLVFHQSFVKSLKNEFSSGSFDIKLEFDGLFRFFSDFGRIVDFNLEYFPNLIAITYTSCNAVNELINKNEISYVNSKMEIISLMANHHQPSIPVRNLKIKSESTYDHFNKFNDPHSDEQMIYAQKFLSDTISGLNCVFLELNAGNHQENNIYNKALSSESLEKYSLFPIKNVNYTDKHKSLRKSHDYMKRKHTEGSNCKMGKFYLK